VAIIIKQDIFKNVLNRIQDVNNNFLLLKVELVHGVVLLGAVYGPDGNDAQFFMDLETGIRNSGCESVILAGDWNATWDPRPVNENIDVINMAAIPSQQRSLCINHLANNLELTDPFWILHPVKREFTYVPNARINLNRSRIDYFLISRSMAEFLIDCKISPSLSSTSFDHKKISLSIGTVKKCKDFNKIDNNFIKNKCVNIMVKTKVIECYILNADPQVLPGYRRRDLLIDLGRIECNVRNSLKSEIEHEQDPLVDAEEILEMLPELELFENLPITVTDDFFF
jgi:hypothetical protein